MSGRGNTALIKREPHDGTAVMGSYRQDTRKAFLLAINRIDERLARIGTHRSFNGLWVRRVNLQGNAHGGLNALDEFKEHGCFVNVWQACIYVQNFGTCFNLRKRFAYYIVGVVCAQGLLEFLFTCGVNALPNNGNVVVAQYDRFLGSRNAKAAFDSAFLWCAVFKLFGKKCEVFRICTAAPAHNAHTCIYHGSDGGCIILWLQREHRFAVDHLGQACVGLHDKGTERNSKHVFNEGSERFWSERTINTQGVYTQSLQGQCRYLWRGSQERTTRIFKSHGGKNGQV